MKTLFDLPKQGLRAAPRQKRGLRPHAVKGAPCGFWLPPLRGYPPKKSLARLR